MTALRRGTRTMVVVLVTLVVLAAMASWLGAGELRGLGQHLWSWPFLAMLLLYFGILYVRAARIALVMERRWQAPDYRYFALAAWHNFAVQLLPLRIGDAVYPALAKRYTGHVMPKGLASLITLRLYELVVLFVIFLLALLTLVDPSARLSVWMGTGAGLLLVSFLAFRYIHYAVRWLACRGADWLLRLRSGAQPQAARLRGFGERLFDEFGSLLSPRQRALMVLLTSLIWGQAVACAWLAMALTRVPVDPGEAAVGLTLASVAQFVPLGTLGGVGAMEAGWVTGFALVDVAVRQALVGALIYRAMMWSGAILAVVPVWIRRAREQPAQPPRSQAGGQDQQR